MDHMHLLCDEDLQAPLLPQYCFPAPQNNHISHQQQPNAPAPYEVLNRSLACLAGTSGSSSTEFLSDLPVSPFALDEPEDADVLNQLLSEECIMELSYDFLNVVQKNEITPDMRRELVDWISDIAEQFQFESCEAYALSISYVDRFCAITPICPSRFQLLGGACLLIAAKLREARVPTCTDICATAANSFTESDLQIMEKLVLSKLRWKLSTVTPSLMLYYFVPFFGPSASILHIIQYASRLLNLVYSEYEFVKYPPSVLALSAIKNSFMYHGYPEDIYIAGFSRFLSHINDKYDLRSVFVHVCSIRMHAVTVDTIPFPNGEFPSMLSAEGQNDLHIDDSDAINTINDTYNMDTGIELQDNQVMGRSSSSLDSHNLTPNSSQRNPLPPAKRHHTPPNVTDSLVLFLQDMNA